MDDRPHLQLPIPSHEELKLYEEWLKQKEEQEKTNDSEERVIALDI